MSPVIEVRPPLSQEAAAAIREKTELLDLRLERAGKALEPIGGDGPLADQNEAN